MSELRTIELSIAAPDAMRALGHSLGTALLNGPACACVVNIEGELGAGKTTLVSGVLRAFGVAGPVRSPTYTLIEPYETGVVAGWLIYHLDLYRLRDPREVEALGVRDLLAQAAVLLIEWPSRGAGMLPPPDLAIDLRYAEAGPGRTVCMKAASSLGDNVLEHIVASRSE